MSVTAVPGALIVRFFLLAGTLALGPLAGCAPPAEPLRDLATGKATLIGSVGEGSGLWGMAIAP